MYHKECCYINWHEEGGGEVHRLWDALVLFDVPQYGGEPRYVKTFDVHDVDELLDVVYSWT